MDQKLVTNKQIKRIDRGIDIRLGELERKAIRALNDFYKKFIEPLSSDLPADSIRRIYDTQVRNIIRRIFQEAYGEGTAIVGREIKRQEPDFELFTSSTDITNITLETNAIADRFWNTTSKLITRKNDFILNPESQTLEHKPEFHREAAMIETAAHIIFTAFNRGIVSKVGVVTTAIELSFQALNRQVPNVPTVTSRPPPGPVSEPPAPGPGPGGVGEPGIEGGPTQLSELRRLKAELVFLTKEDMKVDKEICKPLHKTVYSKDEPGLPTPPLHRHCRCILIPIIEAQKQGVNIFKNDFS